MISNRTDRLIRTLFLLSGIPFLYLAISRSEPNWLYYTSLAAVFAGVVYTMLSDWQQGKKAIVKKRIKYYGIMIVVLAAVASIAYFVS